MYGMKQEAIICLRGTASRWVGKLRRGSEQYYVDVAHCHIEVQVTVYYTIRLEDNFVSDVSAVDVELHLNGIEGVIKNLAAVKGDRNPHKN